MDFNDYANNYSQEIENAFPGNSLKHEPFLLEKANQLISLTKGIWTNSEDLRVLDVGCGTGLMESFLNNKFKSLVGVDIAFDAIQKAKQSGLNTQFIHYDGKKLPFSNNEFDVVFACCVFHHIPPMQRFDTVKDMYRVVAPGGLVVIFEHNPWNPLTRLVVSRCEFDRDAILLRNRESTNLLKAGGFDKILSRQMFYFPWRSKFWKQLERLISWLPLGAQYFVAGCKPTSEGAAQG